MKEQQKAEAYVREKLPELMELSFGCEIPVYKGVDKVLAVENGNVIFRDWVCSRGKIGQDYGIIGHPIQLQHWLRVLGQVPNEYFLIDEDGHVRKMGRPTDYADLRFNLTTGQPATEADFKSFNDIVGI